MVIAEASCGSSLMTCVTLGASPALSSTTLAPCPSETIRSAPEGRLTMCPGHRSHKGLDLSSTAPFGTICRDRKGRLMLKPFLREVPSKNDQKRVLQSINRCVCMMVC